jgi:regulator of sigma E protease
VVVDDPASPAGRAGLRTFDVITALDGRPVEDWNELSRAVVGAEGPLKVTYRRGPADTGAVAETTLEPDPAWAPKVLDADGDVWRRWGFAHSATTVATVSDDSAAKKAGVAVGDHLLAVDGAPIREWDDIVDGVAASASGEGAQMTTRPVELVVRRDGQLVSYAITPKIADPDAENGHRRTPRLGIGGEPKVVSPPLVPRPYPLTEAAPRALDETVTIAGEIVQGIGKILTNEVKLGDSLGGPVEIFRQGRAVARTGLWNVARWMAGISVSIGIINLLPIPVLDGGQFMIYLAEWVRGRPLPLAFRERALQLGVIFLVLLFLFVMVNDIHRAVVS